MVIIAADQWIDNFTTACRAMMNVPKFSTVLSFLVALGICEQTQADCNCGPVSVKSLILHIHWYEFKTYNLESISLSLSAFISSLAPVYLI